MTWYERKIAIDMETGEQHPVVDTLNNFDNDLTPTIFFRYFNDVPIHNAITQCLDTLDMADFINNDDIQKEETKEGLPDSRIYEKDEGRGMEKDSRKGEKGWE